MQPVRTLVCVASVCASCLIGGAEFLAPLHAGGHLAFAQQPPVIDSQLAEKGRAGRPEFQDSLSVEKYRDPASDQLPQNFDTYLPLPMPESPGPTVKAGFVNEIVTYDAVSRKETRSPVLPSAPVESSGSTPYYRGLADALGVDETVLQEAIKNFTALQLISDPEPSPWRVNCKVFLTQPAGTFVGSGVLIDQSHMLTAGHVVHGGPGSNWTSAMTVVPAYHNGVQPYGVSDWAQFHAYTGWTVSGSFDYDIALVDLARPVGALTGWHGYGYNDANSFFTGNTFHNPGYPAESPYNGQNLYYWYGTFDYVGTYQVCVDRYAYGGQSGSGAYYWDGGSGRWVYAIMSNHSGTPSSGTGCLVRITSQRYGDIGGWISEDTPPSLDLTPLWVKGSPSPINAGSALSSMSYTIANTSSASGSVTLSIGVYLSTNDYISTADRRINTRSLSWTFSAKSGVNVTAGAPLPTIPSDVTPGSYWIGVIIDDSDYNNGNNASHGQDAFPVTVVCPSVSAPGSPSTSNPSPCANVSYTISWSPVGGATGYELYENGGKVYDGASTSYPRNHASGSYTYYVRTKNACGSSATGPTGASTSIQATPSTPGAPTTSNPAACEGVPYIVSWSPVGGATAYELYENGGKVYDGANTSRSVTNGPGSYIYYVRAKNSCGTSASGPAGAGTNVQMAPLFAVGPSTTNATPCANEVYTILWSTSPDATAYELYENGSKVYDGPGIDYPTSHPFGSYTYYVVAKNTCGSSPPSSTGGTTTILSCPWQSDFDQDGYITSVDLGMMIDILFAGQPDVQDPDCPIPRADFDCDGYSTSVDLGELIDHLFAEGDPPCDPCIP